ncbi:MAG: hypothetical protein RSD98_02540 [Niameybacter sp.]
MMRKILTACLILFLILVMLMEPGVCIEGATSGLLLWFQKVLPSLLPFIILINLLCFLGIVFKCSAFLTPITKHLLHLSGSAFLIFVLGLISGYPMGAKLIKNLLESGEITFEEAQKALCFASNCGPLFIIGTIGTLMLGQTELGYFLLLVHITSAFIMLLLSRFYPVTLAPKSTKQMATPSKMNFSQAFTASIQNGMDTIVYVGGYIIFFSMLMKLLACAPLYTKLTQFLGTLLHIDPIHIHTFLLSLFEFSSGSAALTSALPKGPTLLAFLSALVAFGGICVLFQTQYVLQGSGLSIKPYILAKSLQSLLAFLLTFVLLPIWNYFFNLLPFTYSFLWPILLGIAMVAIILFYRNLSKCNA